MARRRYPPNLRAVLAELRDAGFDPIVRRGKHFLVEWRDRDGRRRATSVSVTSVNWDAEVRALACVRRVMRQAEALS
jgi:hypothetical protein